jgi:hypothetical protein
MIRFTQNELQTLEAATDAYKFERGDLPDSFADEGYVMHLISVPGSFKILEKLDQSCFDRSVIPTRVIDPWGNRIRYMPAGMNGAPPLKGYYYSCGPDGVPGTTDDIRSTDAAR